MAIALANAFRRAGHAVDFTAVTYNEMPWITDGFIMHRTVAREPRKLLIADRDTELYRAIRELQPDVLFVYGSWLPVYPWIAELECTTVLLMRQTNEPFLRVRRGPIAMDINPGDYTHAFCIEPNFHLDGFTNVPPVIIRNPDEIMSRDEARAALGVPEGKKALVVARNGYPGELEALLADQQEEASQWHRIVTTNRDGAGIFPLADYANGIDLLVSGGGYSTFYETRYFGIPAELSAFERNAEDISWRLRTNKDYEFDSNGADMIVAGVMEETE